MYAKDQYEEKYQLLIQKLQGVDLNCCNDYKASIEHSNKMDIYESIEEYLWKDWRMES